MNILPKISVPSYRLTVPSTGQDITYRPYMVKEEKLLMIAISSEDTVQIQDAIFGVIRECCPDINDMTELITADIEYVFLKLRGVSVGAKIEIIKICEACDEENDVTLNLDNVKVENLLDSKQLLVDVDQNFKIQMKYPGMAVDREETEDALIQLVAECIDTVYYGEDTYTMDGVSMDEIVEFINDLSSKQFSKLVVVLIDAPFVSYVDTYKCKHCGEDNKIYFTGLIDFFL